MTSSLGFTLSPASALTSHAARCEKSERERGKMLVKWNNGLASAGRRPRLALVKEGKIFQFLGTTIPGVAVITTTDFKKNGKWSNTTFHLEVGENVGVAALLAPMHNGQWDSVGSWDAAHATFQEIVGKNVSLDALKAWMLLEYPGTARRFDEIAALLAEVSLEGDPVEFSFGSPTNRAITEGYWQSPKTHGGHEFRLRGDCGEWTYAKKEDIIPPAGCIILSILHGPGMHGGMVTVMYQMVTVRSS